MLSSTEHPTRVANGVGAIDQRLDYNPIIQPSATDVQKSSANWSSTNEISDFSRTATLRSGPTHEVARSPEYPLRSRTPDRPRILQLGSRFEYRRRIQHVHWKQFLFCRVGGGCAGGDPLPSDAGFPHSKSGAAAQPPHKNIVRIAGRR